MFRVRFASGGVHMVRTLNELKLLALVERFDEFVKSVTMDDVAKDLYLYCLIHRGLQDVALVHGRVVFPRWFKREAGVVPIQEYTFINISLKAKTAIVRLEAEGLIEAVNYSERIGEIHSYRLTEAGRKALDGHRGAWDDEMVKAITLCNRCNSPLSLQVDMDSIIEDPLGSHVRAALRCTSDGCDEHEDLDILHIVTEPQGELLYLMSNFTHEGDLWITHNALRILIYEGILYKAKSGRDVFGEWDFAPSSVRFAEGRRYVNVSQEAEDDLNDLRELGLIEEMRMEGPNRQYHTKYRLGDEGRVMIPYLPDDLKQAVDGFVTCKKCDASMVEVVCGLDRVGGDSDCVVRCRDPRCGHQFHSRFTKIEDVSYVSVPFWYGSRNPVPSKTRREALTEPRTTGG